MIRKSTDINENILHHAGIKLVDRSGSKPNRPYFYAIDWPDGSLRWLFKADGFVPGFLAFYPAGNLRAKLGAIFMRLVSGIGFMGRFASKFCDFELLDDGTLAKALIACDCDDWSLFAGTPGSDRKLVAALYKNKKVMYYIKISISDSSLKLIHQEHKAIELFSGFNCVNTIIPNSKLINNFLVLSNVNDNAASSTTKLSNCHFLALNEIYLKTRSEILLCDYIRSNFFRMKCEEILLQVPEDHVINQKDIKKIIHNVKNYINKVDSHDNTKIELSFAHRDFTPWNSFIRKGKLVLLDFELMELDVALGFDLIHYITQSNIMFDKTVAMNEYYTDCIKGFKSIFGNISEDKILNYIYLYNLKQLSDYLPKYLEQRNVHSQVFDQLLWWDKFFSYDFN
jgi:hypothetical protein